MNEPRDTRPPTGDPVSAEVSAALPPEPGSGMPLAGSDDESRPADLVARPADVRPPSRDLVPAACAGKPFGELVQHLDPRAAMPPERHPALIYLAGLAPSSRRVMKKALDIVAGVLTSGACDSATLAWPFVRYQHAQAVRAALAEAFAPPRANLILSAMRGVLKECWRLGYIDGETYQRARDVNGVPGETLPAGRALSDGELRALIETCCESGTVIGARDAALFAVIFGGGLRRAEAVALDVADYDRAEGTLRVRRGKGNKARLVPIPIGAREAIDAWLLVRGALDGDPHQAILCPVRKGGHIVPGRMTAGAVLFRTDRRAIEAGVRRFSPHDARRTFITGLLASGADVVTVQRLAGHSRIETTATYDRRGEDAKRKAVEGVRFPYRGQEARE